MPNNLYVYVCQYIAVDQRLAIRKLLFSHYNTYNGVVTYGDH